MPHHIALLERHGVDLHGTVSVPSAENGKMKDD
jgi:hypothetical protein